MRALPRRRSRIHTEQRAGLLVLMCAPLSRADRGRKSDWEHLPAFDYIVAADCIYTDTSVPELLRTVHAIAGKGTIVIFAFQEHNPDAARKFWTTVDDYFSFERVPPTSPCFTFWVLMLVRARSLPGWQAVHRGQILGLGHQPVGAEEEGASRKVTKCTARAAVWQTG